MLGTNRPLTSGDLTRHSLTGIVTVSATSVAETALLGSTLLTLADLSEVRLSVYAVQTRLAEEFLDQGVDAMIAGFPKRYFEGRVVRIADKPQHRSRNVAIREKRVSMVWVGSSQT